MISKFGDEHEIFYEIKQLNERRIKDIFHENHIKAFNPRIEYLTNFDQISFPVYQTIRKETTDRKSKGKDRLSTRRSNQVHSSI